MVSGQREICVMTFIGYAADFRAAVAAQEICVMTLLGYAAALRAAVAGNRAFFSKNILIFFLN